MINRIQHFYENNINGLKLLDLNTFKEEVLFQENKYNGFFIKWPKHSAKVYWQYQQNVFEYDLITKTKRLLFEGCRGDYGSYFSFSPNGQEMILNWRKDSVINSITLLKETFMLRMDIENLKDLEIIEL